MGPSKGCHAVEGRTPRMPRMQGRKNLLGSNRVAANHMEVSAAPARASAAPAPGQRRLVISWRLAQWLILLAMSGGIACAYVFFLSAGKMNGFPDWPTYNT